MHGVGYRVHEVHHAEEPYKGPALELHVEHEIYHHGGGEDAYDHPGLEFSVAGTGALYDVAHYGVVESVEDTGRNHYGGDGGELGGGEKAGEEHEGEQLAGE